MRSLCLIFTLSIAWLFCKNKSRGEGPEKDSIEFENLHGNKFVGKVLDFRENKTGTIIRIQRFSDNRKFNVPIKAFAPHTVRTIYLNLHASSENDIITEKENNESQTIEKKISYKKVPAFIDEAVHWLINNQNSDGSWGLINSAVLNARNNRTTRYNNSNSFMGDVSSTALSLMALTSYSLDNEDKKIFNAINKGVISLIKDLNKKNNDNTSYRNFSRRGGSPTSKLGDYVDETFVTQMLSKLLIQLPADKFTQFSREDLSNALETCLQVMKDKHNDYINPARKFASVLKSTSYLAALETAALTGKKIDLDHLNEIRKALSKLSDGQRFDSTHSSGIELYSFASAMRSNLSLISNVNESHSDSLSSNSSFVIYKKNEKYDHDFIPKVFEGRILNSLRNNLSSKLPRDRRRNQANLLSGYGSLGGEEYLSFYFINQSMLLSESDIFEKWHEFVLEEFGNNQLADGSWRGMHCISDSSFCTAVVILTSLPGREIPLSN